MTTPTATRKWESNLNFAETETGQEIVRRVERETFNAAIVTVMRARFRNDLPDGLRERLQDHEKRNGEGGRHRNRIFSFADFPSVLHREAMLKRELWRLAPAYATVATALTASFVGVAMLIELAERQLALARSEGSVMRLFGFEVDAASAAPWLIALVLFCGGVGATRLVWPKVTDAWGVVNVALRARSQAWASPSR